MSQTEATPPTATTLPLSCPFCGQAMTVKVVMKPYAEASCQCPYFGCGKVSKIDGIEKVLSVRADYSRNA